MEIYQEEIFGPVLGIVHAATYDEALGLVNAHKYANGTAIFTTDGGAARRFKLEVDVPMIGVNVPIPVPAGYLSFGGAKESAIGDLAMRGEDGDPLLHPAEDGHRALAGARPAGRPEPGLPRQQLGSPTGPRRRRPAAGRRGSRFQKRGLVDTTTALRAALGPVGIWAALDAIPAPEVLRFAAEVEDLGFPALWVNESSGREPFAVLGALARGDVAADARPSASPRPTPATPWPLTPAPARSRTCREVAS